LTNQWFAAGNNDTDFVLLYKRGDGINDSKEIFRRHIFVNSTLFAVASAMLARQIATVRTLPEQLSQCMLFLTIFSDLSGQFQPDAFS
jgi:hypothetical protein